VEYFGDLGYVIVVIKLFPNLADYYEAKLKLISRHRCKQGKTHKAMEKTVKNYYFTQKFKLLGLSVNNAKKDRLNHLTHLERQEEGANRYIFMTTMKTEPRIS